MANKTAFHKALSKCLSRDVLLWLWEIKTNHWQFQNIVHLTSSHLKIYNGC